VAARGARRGPRHRVEGVLPAAPAAFSWRAAARASLRALAETAGVLAPAILLSLVLRFWWTPHLAGAGGVPSPGLVLERLRLWALTQTAAAALVAGAAVAGRRRRPPRPRGAGTRAAFAFVAAAAFAAPFLNPADFSAADLPRLHVYVLPPLLLLGLRAFGGESGPAPPAALPRAVRVGAAVAALVLAAAPIAFLDRYPPPRPARGRRGGPGARVPPRHPHRRGPPGGGRDGRADRGAPGVRRCAGDAPALVRARRLAAGRDHALATGPLAVVIVPARPARTIELLLALEPPSPELRASLGGRPLASEWTAAGWRVLVPQGALLRGDNAVALTRPPGGPPLELRRLRLVPAP
jgi:hypothetical protein